MTTKLKTTLLVALVALAGLAIVATPAAAADVVHNETISIDESVSTVEADVVFDADASATVEISQDGSVVDYQTLDGSADENLTASINASEADGGDAELSIESSDPDDISLEETRLIASQEIEVEDVANESVSIAVGLASSDATDINATLLDESDESIWTASLDESDQGAMSWSIDDSDGLESGNLTGEVVVSPAGEFDALDVSLGDDLLGGVGGVESSTGSVYIVIVVGAIIGGLIAISGRD